VEYAVKEKKKYPVVCDIAVFVVWIKLSGSLHMSLQNVTLLELMDEDDVVQECKSQNKKLVDL